MDFDPVHQIQQQELTQDQQQQGVTDLAPQACSACRKQKRKCDKTLPSCSLCLRIGRPCDYRSEPLPAPSPKNFAALQQQVADLEQLIRSGVRGTATPPPTTAQSSSNGSSGFMPISNGNSSPGDNLLSSAGSQSWYGAASFPSLYFLDSNAFTYERFQVRILSFEILRPSYGKGSNDAGSQLTQLRFKHHMSRCRLEPSQRWAALKNSAT